MLYFSTVNMKKVQWEQVYNPRCSKNAPHLHIVENVCFPSTSPPFLREYIFSFFVKINLSSGPVNVEGRKWKTKVFYDVQAR